MSQGTQINNLAERQQADQLMDLGKKTAENQIILPSTDQILFQRRFPLLNRIDELEELLQTSHKKISSSPATTIFQNHASEWLMDNFYLVEEAFHQIREDFPPEFYNKLPLLSNSEHQALPRVWNLSWVLLTKVEFYPNDDQIIRFVIGFQKETSLKISELWAIPIMLRIGILEALSRTISEITDISLSEFDPKLEWSTSEMKKHNLVANCIQGLRTLKNQDWKIFFEKVSLVEAILNEDPCGVYPLMTFETRDQYRKTVEEISKDSGIDEEGVARTALELAIQSFQRSDLIVDSSQRVQEHVGYYLIERGLPDLLKSEKFVQSGYRPSLVTRSKNWMHNHALLLYLGSISSIVIFLMALFFLLLVFINANPIQLVIALILSIIPVSMIAVNLVNGVITTTFPPRNPLPRIDFSDQAGGIPKEFRTLVVIPALLTNSANIESLIRQIELYHLANQDDQTIFALLTDFPDADQQHMPEDQILLDLVVSGIKQLNNQYQRSKGNYFYLIHREREWNPVDEVWMGWERKRGKLIQLNHLLRNQELHHFSLVTGDPSELKGIQLVLTLDEDTVLPNDTVRNLAGTMAHPFNRPQFEPQSGRVVAGYTFLQPRLVVKPESSNKTWFTRIFAGDGGIDLYSQVISDVYQDLFAEGSYMGKGIYDVDAFTKSLEGQFPQNAVLSHDLIEGIFGRAGLVTDIILYEDFPSSFLEYIQRLHRWVRGDWQLLPWLTIFFGNLPESSQSSRMTPLGTWKLVDNLRRSLSFPAVLAFLLLGWLWLPGTAFLWTVLAFGILAVPLFILILSNLWQGFKSGFVQNLWQTSRFQIARYLFDIVFLPYQSLVMLTAIGSTIWRLLISRKNLLEWTTASQTKRLLTGGSSPEFIWERMWVMIVFVTIIGVWVGVAEPWDLPVVIPVLILWLISPQIAFWINRTPDDLSIGKKPAELTDAQEIVLRMLARKTWLFFEQFMGPEDHWLPPDHFQEKPRGTVAHRTSPTNIGLGLLSVMAAYDLGYIDANELSLRVQNAITQVNLLEKYNGHLLNWYETENLKPLTPRYVSTVDSGNFAGCLLTLKEGLDEVSFDNIIRAKDWQAILDTLQLLKATLQSTNLDSRIEKLVDHLDEIYLVIDSAKDNPQCWYETLITILESHWAELNNQMMALFEPDTVMLDSGILNELRVWLQRTHQHLIALQRRFDEFLPWCRFLKQTSAIVKPEKLTTNLKDLWEQFSDKLPILLTLKDLDVLSESGIKNLAEFLDELNNSELKSSQLPGSVSFIDLESVCKNFIVDLESARERAQNLQEGIKNIHNEVNEIFTAIDFSFLFNEKRNLFRIGFNVDTGKLDENHYDLLASEARLASLIAISTGDVPQKHWLYLGRPLTKTEFGIALLSWSGSIFEFLMPHLLIHHYPNTLIEMTINSVIDKQIEYGDFKNKPWGISESGFYQFDSNMNYQYRAFGVPGLGLKRGLETDLVVTPYASLLALPERPHAVMENISRLENLGMIGLYGFYEALDFTDSRLPLAKDFAPILSFMAHHQGMIMLSLTNFLEKNTMVNRFHKDPRIESYELLLHEQIPINPRIQVLDNGEFERIQRPTSSPTIESWEPDTNIEFPSVHLISNGTMGTLVTSNGGGFTQYLPPRALSEDPIMITRWRPDTTLDNWGTWIYIEDFQNGSFWSSGLQPTLTNPETFRIEYYPHQVVFNRHDGAISTQTSITISVEKDIEIRKISLVNHQNETHQLRITSYGEIVLSDQDSDRRHPAFNKLFVNSEFVPEINGILFHRRPRSNGEEITYVVHMLVTRQPLLSREAETYLHYESDRVNFIGRGKSVFQPMIMSDQSDNPDRRQLSNTDGNSLDPIMSLSLNVDLAPRETRDIAFLTIASPSRSQVIATAKELKIWTRIERTFEKSATANHQDLKKLGISIDRLKDFQQLLSLLIYPHHSLREHPVKLASNQEGQSGLWAFAISGDYPILLVRIGHSPTFSQDDIILVKQLIKAHNFWRKRGILIDLVVLDQSEESYDQDLIGEIRLLITMQESDRWVNKRGGIFLLQVHKMRPRQIVLLETVARAVFDGNKGSFSSQMEVISPIKAGLPHFLAIEEPFDQDSDKQESGKDFGNFDELHFYNGFGGFNKDGDEYIIHLKPGEFTPSTWINVVANPDFGCITTTGGLGPTWAINSGENRLSPWKNDTLSDPPSEILYIRNEETGEFWSPTPLPIQTSSEFLIRFGAGFSIYQHKSHGLEHSLRVFIDPDDPIKFVILKLKNNLERRQLLTLTYYVDWVLGTDRIQTGPYIVPEFNPLAKAFLVSNRYNQEFRKRIAFLSTGSAVHEFTADRTEFLGLNGSYSNPESLRRVGLSGTVKTGLDPCSALRIFLALEPGETGEVFFILGQGENLGETMRFIEKYQNPENVAKSWQATREYWKDLLTTTQVKTPDTAMNIMMNHWLIYQTLACRIWGRSALYQSSGAYGFRDQLQDVMALVNLSPKLTREHILQAASHQFEEGDVLHWWHPPSGRGIRTRCSDNMLWLPYVTAHYIAHTGDTSILWEEIPFLSAKPLLVNEPERYDHYRSAGKSGTLFQHCCLALDFGTTKGRYGLPLIGSHDWNDGFNRLGLKGQGESVWLGYFLYATLRDFSSMILRLEKSSLIPENLKKDELATQYLGTAEELRKSLERHAWDGEWYRRAYFDDGTPLGSSQNDECKIDSLAQSWAVLSKAGSNDRIKQAMNSMKRLLIDRENSLFLLFTPPFENSELDPGYIKGYPPGIRENGGQYTHAALWAIWGYISIGEVELANQLYRSVNPITYSNSPEKISRYKVEPYAVAADVYSVEPHTGKGGWSWYTGSAGWMYQVGLETILGFLRTGEQLRIDPNIPEKWKEFEITYRYQQTEYRIHVDNSRQVNRGVKDVFLDNKNLPDKIVILVNDHQTHEVNVVMG